MDLDQTLRSLEPFREALAGAAVESTHNWYWLVDEQAPLTPDGGDFGKLCGPYPTASGSPDLQCACHRLHRLAAMQAIGFRGIVLTQEAPENPARCASPICNSLS